MSIFKFLLLPLAGIYQLISSFRNYLYEIGYKKSFRFKSIIISVGNLNVGGSGKTPMVEYLVRLLFKRYSVVILSRGYGRKSTGFITAGPTENASTLGDEPYQYYLKFGHQVGVHVCEDRLLAIPAILNLHPETEIILLDDAFQHRSVVPQFSVLVTDFSLPFFNDYLLPMGRLRESRGGASRSDVIIVTKCDEKKLDSLHQIKKHIHQYAPSVPVFFSAIEYKEPVCFSGKGKINEDIILVSGIANGQLLERQLKPTYKVVRHYNFPDHHNYTESQISAIQSAAAKTACQILTTEKDMVKLIAARWEGHLKKEKWFYLPIETRFINHGAEFDRSITDMVESIGRKER